MTDFVVTGDSNKIPVDATIKNVNLHKDPDNTTGWTATQTAGETQRTAYIVPVGKKFIALKVFGANKGVDQDWQFGYSTTTDWTVGNKYFMLLNVVEDNYFNFDCYWEVPAGNYLNIYVSTSGTCNIYGIEMDA